MTEINSATLKLSQKSASSQQSISNSMANSVACKKNMRTNTQQGFSLIELLVALAIGLFVSLAVYSVLSVSESRKRTTTSVNDIDQAGAYAIYQIDQAIRNAGAGLGDNIAYGCPLHAAKNGVQVLPATSFTAPFNTVTTDIRLVPALILENGAGAGGDIIMSMSGTGGLAEIPTKFSATGSNNTRINLQNVVGFRANDRAILVKSNTDPCFITQIDSNFKPTVGGLEINLAGDYYSATISGKDISTANIVAINIGQGPNFTMLGIGTNNSLLSYNLLAPAAADINPAIFIENTYQLKAVYGVALDASSTNITWVTPTGDYAFANLKTDVEKLASIKAIKVALVLRTNLKEKEVVSAQKITVFADTKFANNQTGIEIDLNQTNYRYQAFEATVPLRNNLFEVLN